MKRRIFSIRRIRTLIFCSLFTLASAAAAYGTDVKEDLEIRQADLDQCLQEALENNRRRPASRFAIEMAEAQHRQALAGYWPQVSLQGGYLKMDEPVNFNFPSMSLSLPIGMNFTLPDMNITVLEEESYKASIDATWLLYDGGMRKGFRQQTRGLVDIRKQESRRTDLEIIDSVKRLYWGAVLAIQLHRTGADTLARMEATLNLTETMYKEGSGQVKKTDWLNNRVMVETIRAMVALLEKNELVAQAALANTMGLSWNKSIAPTDTEMPFSPSSIQLDDLVGTAYRFNPDWSQIEAGIRAAEGALTTARSGHYPKLAVTGKLFRWWPEDDTGLATEENKEGWNVGIGLSLPLFSGMVTQNKIAEAKARIAKINEEKILLKEGIGLQVRDAFLSLSAAEKAHQATLDAMESAVENRDLNTRAYQNELVETDDVISAQLMEALMSAQHYKARYDHISLLSKLDLIVGTEILNTMK